MRSVMLAIGGLNLFACIVNVVIYFVAGRHLLNAASAATSLVVAVFCLVPGKRQ